MTTIHQPHHSSKGRYLAYLRPEALEVPPGILPPSPRLYPIASWPAFDKNRKDPQVTRSRRRASRVRPRVPTTPLDSPADGADISARLLLHSTVVSSTLPPCRGEKPSACHSHRRVIVERMSSQRHCPTNWRMAAFVKGQL